MLYSFGWIFNFQVNGSMESFGKPAEEQKAQPVASPSSMQEYSPTVTGKAALS